MIREDNLPRLQWPLGIIVEVYPGKDGLLYPGKDDLIRNADVKIAKELLKDPIRNFIPNLKICLVDFNIGSPLDVLKPSEVNQVQETDIQKSTMTCYDSVLLQSRTGRLIKKPSQLAL